MSPNNTAKAFALTGLQQALLMFTGVCIVAIGAIEATHEDALFRSTLAQSELALNPTLTYERYPDYAWPMIGTPAYNASCEITRAWEDGSALSYCEEDGETWVYDPDGNFTYMHGIRFEIRAPGWFVAPELLQIGPDAPPEAR